MSEFKEGDRVRVTSRHQDFSFDGTVTYADSLTYLEVRPLDHENYHVVRFSDYTVEKIEPPIEFGPGAVLASTLATRANFIALGPDGEWYWLHGDGRSGFDTDYWKDAVRNRKYVSVLFWGQGVTPPDWWTAS